MKIAKNSVVSVAYTLKSKDGKVLDQAEKAEPLTYLQGYDNLLPKFEANLEGKAVGDSVDFVLSPEEGYGERQEDLVMEVPMTQFEGVDNLQPGMQFEAQVEGGAMIFSVLKVEGDKVTIDGNPPMAGVELHFSVTVVEVREASEEEISHGHVHGPGGAH